MRRLILLRHAKSGWDDPDLPDHDRVLNARGRRACAAIGPWMRDAGLFPDQVLCSTAARTVETWDLLSRSLPHPPTPDLAADLYLAAPGALTDALRRASGACVALLGHNPGIGELAAQLCRQAPTHPQFGRFPTLATLVADFDISDWSDLRPGTGTVVHFIVPRDLTG